MIAQESDLSGNLASGTTYYLRHIISYVLPSVTSNLHFLSITLHVYGYKESQGVFFYCFIFKVINLREVYISHYKQEVGTFIT